MIFIPRWQRYKDKKPSSFPEINWNNEITEGLNAFVFPELDTNLVTGIDSVQSDFTRENDHISLNGSQVGVVLDADDIDDVSNSITLLSIADVSQTDINMLLGRDQNGGTGRTYQFRINAGSLETIHWPGVIFHMHPGGTAGKRTFSWVKDGTTSKLWIDDSLNSNTGAASTLDKRGTDMSIGSRVKDAALNFSEALNGDVYLSIEWNRALSDDEYLSVLEHPYQLLKPKRRFFVFSSTAGAAALEAAATAETQATGNIDTAIPITAASVMVATASGTLTVPAAELAATAQIESSASGALNTQINLSGAAIAEALAQAPLQTQINLVGQAQIESTATADLNAGIGLSGNATQQVGANASLTTQITLSGEAISEALAQANLTAPGSGLSGHATVEANAYGALVTEIPLTAAATAQATLSGQLQTAIPLQAVAVSAVNVSGGLETTIEFNAHALAEALVQGDLTVENGLSAAVLIEALSTADISTQIQLSTQALVSAQAAGALTDISGFKVGAPVIREKKRGYLFRGRRL